jgi:GNAT superfamily N-acetyltransferase
MKFELNQELIEMIIFSMENQSTAYYLDTHKLNVVAEDDIEDYLQDHEEKPDESGETAFDERFISIPEWRSVDGYNLMEKFVASLHNPIFRERLRNILASGRGVFRQFKDTVKEKKEIERLWYSFKEREMRQVVREWYNDLREQWGLERMELKGTETEQLIITDFVFGNDVIRWRREISEGDRAAFAEMFEERGDAYVEWVMQSNRKGFPDPLDDASLVITAETPAEEFAGFAWGLREDLSDGRMIFLLFQLYVMPEYRGLGLGTGLFERLCDAAYGIGADRMELSLFGEGKIMQDYIKSCGFDSIGAVFGIEMRSWHRKNRE